jgi:hypothetical protein
MLILPVEALEKWVNGGEYGPALHAPENGVWHWGDFPIEQKDTPADVHLPWRVVPGSSPAISYHKGCDGFGRCKRSLAITSFFAKMGFPGSSGV